MPHQLMIIGELAWWGFGHFERDGHGRHHGRHVGIGHRRGRQGA